MEKIKVAIVEDDNAWLKLMTRYLENQEDIEVVATACNKQEAIQLPEHYSLKIILMDINLTGSQLDGISAMKEILKYHKVKIIMITSFEDEEIMLDSFLAGANNYILKDQFKDIPDAIRKAINQVSPYEVLLKDYIKVKNEGLVKSLTRAEKEVFSLLEKEYSIINIANVLYKSESTIKKQINSIYRKLSVKNRKEALEKVKNICLGKKQTYDN